RGVGKRAVVSKFLKLADVVQKRSRQQQVAVDLGIVAAEQIAGAEQGHDVIEQSADVGMMKRLGGGGVAVALGDLGVGHEQFHQRLQLRILERGDKLGQRPPELADVLGGFRQVVGEVDLSFFHAPQLVNGELKAILVLVDESLDLEEVFLLEDVDEFFDVVPHLGFDLAGAIGQGQSQVRLA